MFLDPVPIVLTAPIRTSALPALSPCLPSLAWTTTRCLGQLGWSSELPLVDVPIAKTSEEYYYLQLHPFTRLLDKS
jgi:hypothetical protein